jgi:hypothetical protein
MIVLRASAIALGAAALVSFSALPAALADTSTPAASQATPAQPTPAPNAAKPSASEPAPASTTGQATPPAATAPSTTSQATPPAATAPSTTSQATQPAATAPSTTSQATPPAPMPPSSTSQATTPATSPAKPSLAEPATTPGWAEAGPKRGAGKRMEVRRPTHVYARRYGPHEMRHYARRSEHGYPPLGYVRYENNPVATATRGVVDGVADLGSIAAYPVYCFPDYGSCPLRWYR